ncbi:MAG: acyl-ACP--UDP-N-acetylglucosamine O-acyltransferase [Candidatus Gastranaerophilales bacterium]|nr:acyl-ACP--UDP-N-acetylglucosamine O-acyltransferase [Candidatus Gastranaerophilales bacterium]
MENKIHNLAVIDETAKIGQNVTIGAFSVIGKDVVIEDNCVIGENANIQFAHIGKNTRISPFASIGGEPQDLGYKNEKTGVIIGENCWIREFATINRASGEGNNTIIGNNCLLMAYTHVAHNCVLGDNVIMANAATLGGHCHVGFGVFLGGQSVFHQNLRIGDMAIVSGASAARLDIIPYCKAEGIPAVPMGTNAIGLKRKDVDKESRDALHKAIRLLKSEEYNTTQALELIEEEFKGNKYIDNLVDFVRSSKRGCSLKNRKSTFGQNEE